MAGKVKQPRLWVYVVLARSKRGDPWTVDSFDDRATTYEFAVSQAARMVGRRNVRVCRVEVKP